MVRLSQDYFGESRELGRFASVDEAKTFAENAANLSSPVWVDHGNGYIDTEDGAEAYLVIRPC